MKNLLFKCMIFVFISLGFSALFPYPIFSSHTNITSKQATQINNYLECEMKNQTNFQTKILSLDWNEIQYILPSQFEIIDLENENLFHAEFLGGINHADIKPLDDKEANLKQEIRPVLVKLSENAYLPASLFAYPHGFESHICLHFKNSKTHGTNKIDQTHQKTIKNATKLGAKYLKKQ